MLAVIKTGGKQYAVEPGKKIKIEKLLIEEGKDVVFDQVLLVQDKDKVEVGNPFLKDTQVTGKVLKHDKAKKLIVFKFKAKKRQKTKRGHRQNYTEVEIMGISSPALKS